MVRIFAGDKNIDAFFVDIFSTNDPIICIWNPPNMEKIDIWNDVKDKSNIKHFNLFEKDQFRSLLFPDKIIVDEWCLVLATIKPIAEGGLPLFIYGWFFCADCTKLSFDFDF